MEFHSEVFALNEKYIDGYWQTEKYFKEIEVDNQLNLEIKEKMEATNSVALHIRRGDYLSEEVKNYTEPQVMKSIIKKPLRTFVRNMKMFISLYLPMTKSG